MDDGIPGMIKITYDDNITDYAEDPNNWVLVNPGKVTPIQPPPKPKQCPGPGPCPPPPVSPTPFPGPLSDLFDAEFRQEEVMWKDDFHTMLPTGSENHYFAFRKEEPAVVYTVERMTIDREQLVKILHIWEPYEENKTPYDSHIQKLIIEHDLLSAEPNDDLEPEPWADPTEPWMEEFEAPEGICLFCDETEGLEAINLDGHQEELCETCRDPEQYLAEDSTLPAHGQEWEPIRAQAYRDKLFWCIICGHTSPTGHDPYHGRGQGGKCEENGEGCRYHKDWRAENWGGDPDGPLAKALEAARAKKPKKLQLVRLPPKKAESFSADWGEAAGHNISPYSDQEIADFPLQHGIVCSMCGYNKFKKSMATYNKVHGTTVYYPCNRCDHVQVAIFHDPEDGIGKGSFAAESVVTRFLGEIPDWELRMMYKQGKITEAQMHLGIGLKMDADSFEATTSPAGTKGSGMSRLKADAIINKVKAHMGPHLDFIEVCGSYRRGNSTPKDLDFVVIPKEGVTLPNILPPNQGVNWVGDKKAQVVIDNETVDFRVSSLTGLGAALMYFTGPAGYNIGMRMRAKKMGLKLNEYGVFDRNTGVYIAGATETDVYQALGKNYKSPDLRGK